MPNTHAKQLRNELAEVMGEAKRFRVQLHDAMGQICNLVMDVAKLAPDNELLKRERGAVLSKN